MEPDQAGAESEAGGFSFYAAILEADGWPCGWALGCRSC